MIINKFSTPINFIIFQFCWFGCVFGAANNLAWLGPILVLTTAPLQVLLLTEDHKGETLFVFICGISGFLLETAMIYGNVYKPLDITWGLVCPPWMAALWFNFALLVSISLGWLKKRYGLALILGGFAGPLAYWGGEKLGAITVNSSFLHGYLPLAILWALSLPYIIYIHSKLTKI
jgi:hypothetical protein